jgi:hypothetical protein
VCVYACEVQTRGINGIMEYVCTIIYTPYLHPTNFSYLIMYIRYVQYYTYILVILYIVHNTPRTISPSYSVLNDKRIYYMIGADIVHH